MSFQLERVGTFLKPNPSNTWEAGGTFNPGFFGEPGSKEIVFTYRGTPVDGETIVVGDERIVTFAPGIYISSVGHGKLHFDPQIKESTTWRFEKPWLTPNRDDPHYQMVESMGYEDASRLSKITTSRSNKYLLPHTAVGVDEDGNSIVRIGLVSHSDLDSNQPWDQHGIVGPNVPSKAAAYYQHDKDKGHINMLLTIGADTKNSAIYHRRFNNVEEIINPSARDWEDFLENRDQHVVMHPSPTAHRGPEVGGILRISKDHLLLAYAPESHREEWKIAYALLDAHDPTQVLATTEPVLEAELDAEIRGPVCKNCVFPGTPIAVDSEGVVVDLTKIQDISLRDDIFILQPHGQGDTQGAFAIAKLTEVYNALAA